jgi:hypothetical protein
VAPRLRFEIENSKSPMETPQGEERRKEKEREEKERERESLPYSTQ